MRKRKNPHLLRHKEYLTLLTKSKGQSKRCKCLINAANKGEINSLVEACLNVLQGNAHEKHLQNLKKHRVKVRKVANRSTSLTGKKKTLQSGGFLAALLPVIASAVGGLLGGLKR